MISWADMDWLDLRAAVRSAAPWLDPPAQYWLESDCSASYCRKCAIAARGREFELGPLLVDPDWFGRDEWHAAFFAGLSSYEHGCPSESDVTEACDTCGETLAYRLTDYGIKAELDHWADAEMTSDWSEIAYNIDRLFDCDDEDREEVRAFAIRFLTARTTQKGG